jgi:hypothetical protein
MTPEINAIYSYTNGFGYVSTIKILEYDEKIVGYIQLNDNSEWNDKIQFMTIHCFSIYKKITL